MPRIGIGVDIAKGGGFSWQAYWATLISATVENAAPTHVVLTFPAAQSSLGATDFTIDGFTISSASWAGAELTLVLSVGVSFYEGNFNITFVKTGGTAEVTNNIANDGKTVVWYDATDASTITEDGSHLISAWNDKLASGKNLVQADDAYKPTYADNAVLYNMSRLSCTNIGSTVQPNMYYLLFKYTAMVGPGRIVHGLNQVITSAATASSTPAILISAGGGVYKPNAPGAVIPLNEYVVVAILFSGADSWIKINGGEKIACSIGKGHNGQPTHLGWMPSGEGNKGSYRIMILRANGDSDTLVAEIEGYLEKKK